MRLGYVHLPRFPIQRRVLDVPSLRGKAFVLTHDVQGVRRVAFASGEALRLQVRPGMPLTAALALGPQLLPLPHQPELAEQALQSLGEALLTLAPAFELAPPDGLWLDAAGAHLCGEEAGWCGRVEELLASHGYRATLAVASERFTARCLARAAAFRPHAAWALAAPGQGARALSGLPLSALDEEDLEAARGLGGLGLRTLGELAALPRGPLSARWGAAGLLAQRRARGEDDRLFTPTPLKDTLEEALELGFAAESAEPLLFAFKTVFDRLCARLQGRRQAAVRVELTLRLEPRGEVRVGLSLARPSTQVRMLVDLARFKLESLSLSHPVVAVKARVEEASAAEEQQLLLGEGPQGDASLEAVLSRVSTALGEEALRSLQPEPRHRPEAAQGRRPFRPPRSVRGLGALLAPPEATLSVAANLKERPVRLLPRPLPLEVELSAQGVLSSVRVEGKRRPVVAFSGPERLSGDWWAAMAFSRDYYRVVLEGTGPVWMFRELPGGAFFLHGMFD